MIILLLSAVAIAGAEAPGYSIDWWTVDGGGITFSSNGGYSLGGTIGQPDAGVLGNQGYILNGGFWSVLLANQLHQNLAPLILR